MKLSLERKYLKPDYTIGNLSIDGIFFCNTLEDTNRDLNKNGVFDLQEFKIYGKTAIPYGEYKIKLILSPKRKRIIPLLINVPQFTAIEIHSGNTVGDTDGCILVGENKEKGKVLNSREWETKLVELMQKAEDRGDSITIKII